MFQHTVNRQYGTGVVGEIINDGPLRARPARITGVTGTPNRVGRAFGWIGDGTTQGMTTAATTYDVSPGAASFFGILAHPKHYTLFGASPAAYVGEQAGPLSPTLDLADGSEGEFVDMGILLVDVRNGNDTSGDLTYGANLYYCVTAGAAAGVAIATTQEDVGALYMFHDETGIDADPRFNQINRAFNLVSATAVASGAEVFTKVQLTR